VASTNRREGWDDLATIILAYDCRRKSISWDLGGKKCAKDGMVMTMVSATNYVSLLF
jgi:endonuclease I